MNFTFSAIDCQSFDSIEGQRLAINQLRKGHQLMKESFQFL